MGKDLTTAENSAVSQDAVSQDAVSQHAASPTTILTTARLRLRPWKESDRAAFAALNADPRVMEFLPQTLSRTESDAFAGRIVEAFGRHGFGLWAVEVAGLADFVGFVGLNVPGFAAPFLPRVEVGWRLAFEHWRQGYATEAAAAALDFAFGTLLLDEVVSFTVPANDRSQRVMQRLGMTRSAADDFDHPRISAGHALRRHVLYRMARTAWIENQRSRLIVSHSG